MKAYLNFLDGPYFRQVLVALGPIVINGVGGMIQGYSSILLPQLQHKDSTLKVDTHLSSLIASMPAPSMAIGCLLGGFFMEKFGRRATHIWACFPLILGWFLIASAPNVIVIMAGRFLTGLSDGLLGPSTGVYIAETSHPNVRGVLMVLISVSITLGVSGVHLLGTFFTWRVVAFVSGLITVPFLILMLFLPESPTYLAIKGRIEDAKEAFIWCRGDSESSLKELAQLIERQKNRNNAPKLSMAAQMKNIRDPMFWKPTLIISVLFFTSQITGNAAVVSYSISIIQECGLKGEILNEYLAMSAIDFFRVLASILSCILVFKMTRRNLIKLSTFGVSVTLFLVCSSLYLLPRTIAIYPFVILAMLMSYVSFISVGLLPLSWTMMGEIFPVAYRGSSTAISSFTCFVFLYLVVETYPYLFEFFGSIIGVFLVYGFCTLSGAVILTLFLPETKDKPLHEIEDSFISKKLKKDAVIEIK